MRNISIYSCLIAGCAVVTDPELSPPPEDDVQTPIVFREMVPATPQIDCTIPREGLVPEALQRRSLSMAALPAVDHPWALGVLAHLREAPMRGPCVARVASATSVGELIRASAAWLGEPALFRDRFVTVDLDSALRFLCANVACEEQGQRPLELGAALAPIVLRLRLAVDAVLAHRQHAGTRTLPEWVANGGDGLLASPSGTGFDPQYSPDFVYLDAPRAEVFQASSALAAAIEAVDWSVFRGQFESWRLNTPWGPVIVAGSADDTYAFASPPLLLVELGGNDRFNGRAGSTTADVPVAVVIDVDGADVHGYLEWTEDAGELPADGAGRWSGDRFQDVSVSSWSQQGGARSGIALWFDWGASSDVYVSLRAGQGYAQHGVGVLFDAGGDDIYRIEAAGQGAAQFGIGLLVDGGGDDVYEAENASQGHGYTRGVGLLVDVDGNDAYRCRPTGRRFVAPQLDDGQVSLCQGAGFGFRDEDPGLAMPGGFGMLVDRAGDDSYAAGVYGQGVGLSDGVGILFDLEGSDTYDVLWHGLGAGVHGGVGVLTDAGVGADRYNALGAGHNVLLGAGHDNGVGIFLDEGGDDFYRPVSLSVGAATCGGIGLFVDETGNDRYEGSAARAFGYAENSGCSNPGMALMVDAGGRDVYPPAGAAEESKTWTDGVGGFGLDGEGASGLGR